MRDKETEREFICLSYFVNTITAHIYSTPNRIKLKAHPVINKPFRWKLFGWDLLRASDPEIYQGQRRPKKLRGHKPWNINDKCLKLNRRSLHLGTTFHLKGKDISAPVSRRPLYDWSLTVYGAFHICPAKAKNTLAHSFYEWWILRSGSYHDPDLSLKLIYH